MITNKFESTFIKHRKLLFEHLGIIQEKISPLEAMEIFKNQGVNPSEYSPEELKRKYRELVKKYHPDTAPPDKKEEVGIPPYS